MKELRRLGNGRYPNVRESLAKTDMLRCTRTAVQNHRPVSLLSVLSKVMEKVVNRRIMTYLEKENLLSKHQFGFRTGLGTADLLTSLNHQWLSCINTGGAVRVLAVDIAGAFDRVSHLGSASQNPVLRPRRYSPPMADQLLDRPKPTGCLLVVPPLSRFPLPRGFPRAVSSAQLSSCFM